MHIIYIEYCGLFNVQFEGKVLHLPNMSITRD